MNFARRICALAAHVGASDAQIGLKTSSCVEEAAPSQPALPRRPLTISQYRQTTPSLIESANGCAEEVSCELRDSSIGQAASASGEEDVSLMLPTF